jgi:hypothetical protein
MKASSRMWLVLTGRYHSRIILALVIFSYSVSSQIDSQIRAFICAGRNCTREAAENACCYLRGVSKQSPYHIQFGNSKNLWFIHAKIVASSWDESVTQTFTEWCL